MQRLWRGGGVTQGESTERCTYTFVLAPLNYVPPPPFSPGAPLAQPTKGMGREGKEWCEADGHCGLRRERPREGKGKVRPRRKRKVTGR